MLKLKIMNINTIENLAKADPLKLYPYFKNQSTYLIKIANGIDDSKVNSNDIENKGISNEITLPKDIDNCLELDKYLHA